MKDGSNVEIKPFYTGTISKEKQEEAFEWLRDNGYEDLIKNQVIVKFGRAEDEKAKSLFLGKRIFVYIIKQLRNALLRKREVLLKKTGVIAEKFSGGYKKGRKMPKLKTNKSAAKRFKITKSGKLKTRSANRGHILGKMSRKTKRKLRSSSYVSDADASLFVNDWQQYDIRYGSKSPDQDFRHGFGAI